VNVGRWVRFRPEVIEEWERNGGAGEADDDG
jgi:hypothetical protein